MRSDLPRHARWLRVGSAWLAALVLLAGCASKAPAPATEAAPKTEPPVAVAPPTPDAAWSTFQQQHRAAADAAEQRGQWAQVLWHLDVLLALTPADAELQRRRTLAEQAAQAAAAERQQRARQARARGDHESATRLYLEQLSLMPGDTDAAEALRSLERERVKRQHLGQLSRNTLTRRMGAEPAMPANNMPAVGTGGTDRNELEHASLLASQGELDGAIAVLKALVNVRRPDPAVRRLLADLYVRQADSLLPTRRDAAIAALERAVQADPTHPRAVARLKELSANATTPGTKAIPAKPSQPAAR
jgi:tetratricopeptide (TPR) repeat protein